MVRLAHDAGGRRYQPGGGVRTRRREGAFEEGVGCQVPAQEFPELPRTTNPKVTFKGHCSAWPNIPVD